MKSHPNATAATGGGVTGILVVYLLGLAGVDIGAEAGAAISTGAAAAVLFLGRNGLQGALRIVWKGKP